MFLLDAFKEEYITESNTPYLYNLSREGNYIEKIVPSAGFCERTEIFFGLKPNESGFFTAIGFDPDNAPYRRSRLLFLIGLIEEVLFRIASILWKKRQNSVEYHVRRLLWKTFRLFNKDIKRLGTYNIPFKFLEYFNLTEDENNLHEIDKLCGKESVFKLVSKLNGNTYMGAFTALGQKSNGDDKNRIKLAIKAASDKNNIFIPIYVSVADSIGHNYGPNSKEMEKEVNALDSLLEESVQKLLEIDSNTKFLFLGDHGMSEVESTINVKLEISKISKRHKLKEKRDFIYFLDSTLLRMWFFNDESKDIFLDEMNKNEEFTRKGLIISKSLADKYKLPFENRKYGDLMWWANEGVLIYPDFFHKRKIMKGMHGYRPNKQSTYGTGIIWHKGISKGNIERLELHNIYAEIVKLLR